MHALIGSVDAANSRLLRKITTPPNAVSFKATSNDGVAIRCFSWSYLGSICFPIPRGLSTREQCHQLPNRGQVESNWAAVYGVDLVMNRQTFFAFLMSANSGSILDYLAGESQKGKQEKRRVKKKRETKTKKETKLCRVVMIMIVNFHRREPAVNSEISCPDPPSRSCPGSFFHEACKQL